MIARTGFKRRALKTIALCVLATAASSPSLFAQSNSTRVSDDVSTHRFQPAGMASRHAMPEVPRKKNAARPATPISPAAYAQIKSLLDEKRSRNAAQRKMTSNVLYTSRMLRGLPVATGIKYLDTGIDLDQKNRIAVDISATVSEDLLNRLSKTGAAVLYSNAKYHAIRAMIPADRAEEIAGWNEVRSISERRAAKTARVVAPTTRGQAVSDRLRAALKGVKKNDSSMPTTEGDITHQADKARLLGIDGTGLKIGVMSDGVTSLADSQALGALGPVTVLPGQVGQGDEGTAMLEIVHTLAPGATLYFATAFTSIESFADNIRALRAAGCDIIVDDVSYYVETPFQDGQADSVVSDTDGGVVIQAVNDVTADGAWYFSSAANEGNMDWGISGTWEGDFKDGGAADGVLTGYGNVHLFGTVPYDSNLDYGQIATLFWADPLGGSTNDYDFFLVSEDGTTIWDASLNIQDGTQDPYEALFDYLNPGDRLVVVKAPTASNVFMHIGTWPGVLEQATMGATVGHNGGRNTFSVAATPACGAIASGYPSGPCNKAFDATSLVEPYSSDGPRHIFFNADSTPITAGDLTSTGGTVLNKVDFTAADGVSVTGVGGFPNPFYGTSAAAPHAAAIAALVKSAKPDISAADLTTALTSTAIDIMGSGYDNSSGAGIIMALPAVNAAGLTTGVANPVVVTATAAENPGNGDGILTAGEGGALTVTLGNPHGAAKASGITATLVPVTPGVTVTTPASSAFGDLDIGATSTNATTFAFTLPANFDDCAGWVDFQLMLNYTGGPAATRTLQFSVPVGAPAVVVNGTFGSAASTTAITGVSGTQTGRVLRDGSPSVCGTKKPFPGMFDGDPHGFDSYTFTACRSGCVNVTMQEPNYTGSDEQLFVSGYIPLFDPTDPISNWQGDAGYTFNATGFGVDALAGNDVAITVTDVSNLSTGASYSLTIPGCSLTCVAPNTPPVALAKDINAIAGTDGTADADVDNGSYSPSGLAITKTQSPAGPYPTGTTAVTLTVTDAYGASAQATANVTVTVPVTISTTTDSGTVKAGDTATFTFNVTSVSNDLAFSCSGLPADAVCAFNKSSFTTTNGVLSGTVDLTISTTASQTVTASATPASNGAAPMYAAFALPIIGLLGMGRRKNRKALLRMIVTMALFVLALGLASCGDSHHSVIVPGTPAGTYAITVNATNASGTATTTVNLTVN
ncbi:S8 family peptidase [Candidatus Korobacter versatilis]|nr:S8 family serine peptidase [Candidatus Koribacter versatilis]